ncbi:hypothetical protein BS47DRAFT_77879 [Hydnum rufescens UP504]|uniref:Uncharacterized protein n=1 Tax=Hydnum rufescens UP504 TaxID=1448309 RepID=A0A9P6B7Z3_9AGAM|nr:hypothetical protein BS47DRAFT_77879 [Hydnum rufescens UP504]
MWFIREAPPDLYATSNLPSRPSRKQPATGGLIGRAQAMPYRTIPYSQPVMTCASSPGPLHIPPKREPTHKPQIDDISPSPPSFSISIHATPFFPLCIAYSYLSLLPIIEGMFQPLFSATEAHGSTEHLDQALPLSIGNDLGAGGRGGRGNIRYGRKSPVPTPDTIYLYLAHERLRCGRPWFRARILFSLLYPYQGRVDQFTQCCRGGIDAQQCLA